MSWFSSFMHPGRAYDAASGELNNAWGDAQGYQQPFQQAGAGQIGNLNEIIQNMLDPSKLQNEWSKSYQMSPEAMQLQKEAQTQGLDSASAMGLGGSSAALSNIQNNSTNIMNKDRQSYLDDLMKKYQTGVSTAQNMFGVGANTAGQMGQQRMNLGSDQAGLKYGSQQAGGNMFGKGLGSLADLFKTYATGGFDDGIFGNGLGSSMYGGG